MPAKRSALLVIAIALAVAAGAGGIVYASYYRPQYVSPEELPDDVIIDTQKDLKEVGAFLDAYPDRTTTTVDRSGRLAVEYRVDDAGTGQYLRLRVFSDTQPRPLEMFADCFNGTNSTLYHENVLEYIESRACLGY